MLRRLVPLALLAGMVSLAAVACGGGGDDATPTPQRPSPPPPSRAPAPTSTPAPTTTETPVQPDGVAQSVDLEDPGGSGDYQFNPSELVYKVGDTVTFSLSAETEFHTFTIDELGIDVSMDSGTTDTLTYTFDKPGTFPLICIPHELLGMVGTITVQ